MKKLIALFIIPVLVICTINSCKKDEALRARIIPKLKGVVQKGPFINGTSVTVYELDQDGFQTGSTYTSQIIDNSGNFQIGNVSLTSPYIMLRADGYYFNEVTGAKSKAPITLFAITDITNKTSVNVNVISTLEKSRIEFLLGEGYSFSNAKKQAEQEVLKIFSINKSDIQDSDLLSITAAGDDNAILLALSCMLQGYRSESELSELLANISSDITADGLLTDTNLGSDLLNHARLLDPTKIRNNIQQRYASLGLTINAPAFETYVNHFIDSTSFQVTKHLFYPEFSPYGENILYPGKTTFGPYLSLAANVPEGASLKIVIKGPMFYFQIGPNAPQNWTFYPYDSNLQEQVFIVTTSGKPSDIITIAPAGTRVIDYYENNATHPTWSKTVTF